jgi:hypothetical protein
LAYTLLLVMMTAICNFGWEVSSPAFYSMGNEGRFPLAGVKRPECKPDHSPLVSSLRMIESYTFTPPYASMADRGKTSLLPFATCVIYFLSFSIILRRGCVTIQNCMISAHKITS